MEYLKFTNLPYKSNSLSWDYKTTKPSGQVETHYSGSTSGRYAVIGNIGTTQLYGQCIIMSFAKYDEDVGSTGYGNFIKREQDIDALLNQWLTLNNVQHQKVFNFSESETRFHAYISRYLGLFLGTTTAEITISNDIPVFLSKTLKSLIDAADNITLTISGTCYIVDDTDINKPTGSMTTNSVYFPLAYTSPIPPQKIYHDIYIDGNNKPSIGIHTHHNIESTTVTSNVFYNLAKDPYKLPLLLDGSYSRLGSCEYDKGMIQEFTFEQLDSLAVDNLKLGTGLIGIAKRAINEVQKGHCSIALSFRDDYVETAPNISSMFTMFAVIGDDGTHAIRENLHPLDIPQSDNSPSSLVEIRFFDGKIPDEIKADSDNGNDTDGKNYDGSDKDYAKQDDYSSSDDMPDGNDIGSVSPWHSVYKITDIQMQSLASKIWSQDFFSILKVNDNPIENIVSLKRFPFDVTGTGQADIKIGDISTGVNGEKIVKGVYTTSKWTIDIKPKYKNFLDYYQTNLTLFLPFIGFTPLDTHIFMGKTLGVVYKIDLMSGVCKAQIYRNNDMMLERDGQCGIDIAISSSTQKQSELANAMRLSSSVADIGMGIASGNVFGVTSGIDGLLTNGVKNSFSSTSSNAPISNSSKIAPYIIYDRPITSSTNASGYPSNYKSSVGVPCGITYKLSSLSGGFNVCGNDIKFPSTLKATKEEQEMIISKLRSGVVL